MKLLAFFVFLLPGFAQAEYKVCGKFLECGVFAASDYLEKNGQTQSIRLLELNPGEITFYGHHNDDPVADNLLLTLKFSDDGHFTVNFMKGIAIGEGSCQNMVCQFKVDDSDWSIYAEPKRPPMQVSGTVSFANGHISRVEVRKPGRKAPFFVTGVLESLCANEEWRQKLAPGKRVTEESCLTYFTMRLKTLSRYSLL